MLNFIRGVCRKLETSLGFSPILIPVSSMTQIVNSTNRPTQFLHKPVSQVPQWDYG